MKGRGLEVLSVNFFFIFLIIHLISPGAIRARGKMEILPAFVSPESHGTFPLPYFFQKKRRKKNPRGIFFHRTLASSYAS